MSRKSKKTLSYRDLFELNQSYIEFILKKTLISHNYLKNFSLSGSQIEEEVRKVFRAILPSRFKVTQGYIAYTRDTTEDPIISPQLDLIIVDTLVPHSILTFVDKGEVEVVPYESVLGIFEIKRTLNPSQFKKAYSHLAKVMKKFDIKKDSELRFLPGGFTMGTGMGGGFHGNPILGIISLTIEDINKNKSIKEINSYFEGKGLPNIDIINSLDGKLLFLHYGEDQTKKEQLIFCNPIIRSSTDVKWLFQNFELVKGDKPISNTAKALGFITGYLSQSCAKSSRITDYYFHKVIK